MKALSQSDAGGPDAAGRQQQGESMKALIKPDAPAVREALFPCTY